MDKLRTKHLLYLLIILFATVMTAVGCKGKKSMKMGMRDNPYKVTSDNLLSVESVDDKQAWVIGSFGNIFHTSDGGKTWKKQNSKTGEQLCEVDFVDALNGWIVGSNGTILNTADGGKTWTPQKSPVERLFVSVDFSDKLHGCAVGEQGSLVRTVDGGKTWQDHSIEWGPVLNGISFVDKDTGWIVGDYGTILHTRDGGITWEEQKCQDIIPVVAADEWEQPAPMLYAVNFADKNRGWAAGADGIIIHTEDGGTNWRKLPTNSKGKIYSIEVKGKMGLAVGDKGTYISSSDGGLIWNASIDALQTRKWLRDQSLFGDNGGYIVGSTGTLIQTTDSGKNWKMISGKAFELPISKKMFSKKES